MFDGMLPCGTARTTNPDAEEGVEVGRRSRATGIGTVIVPVGPQN
jgi:hypothetical protein